MLILSSRPSNKNLVSVGTEAMGSLVIHYICSAFRFSAQELSRIIQEPQAPAAYHQRNMVLLEGANANDSRAVAS